MIIVMCRHCGSTVERQLRTQRASCDACRLRGRTQQAAKWAARHRERRRAESASWRQANRDQIRLARKYGMPIGVARARLAVSV